MGHGCVPVVADHAGPGEIVTAESGLKIPVTDPGEFVEKLAGGLKSLFLDPERRRRLGEGARKRVLEEFSRQRWLERVEAVYRAVLPATRARP
jgi:glycosyltransferase involved in cell wall biosynthesis